jgi:hypothetical protein
VKELITKSDSERDILMFTSFRYCLGRHTYVVSTCVEILMNNANNISAIDRAKYIKEINEYFFDHPIKGYVSHQNDYEEWQSVKALFQRLNDKEGVE